MSGKHTGTTTNQKLPKDNKDKSWRAFNFRCALTIDFSQAWHGLQDVVFKKKLSDKR